MTETVEEARQWMGGVDVLVNAAGINKDTLLIKTSEDLISDQLNTNLVGTIFTCKAALRHMVKQRKGCIINIGEPIACIARTKCAHWSMPLDANMQLALFCRQRCGK